MRAPTLSIFFLTAFLIGSCVAVLRAQDHGGHAQFHKDFYQNWREPGNPNASCCNARIEKDGVETGDCEPTKAEVRKGQWYAFLRQEQRWIPIDDAKLVRERNPNIFDAHICWTPGRGVICFSPPDTGG